MTNRYLKIWWLFTINSFQTQLSVRWGLALFLIAKILRFALFLFFLVILVKATKTFAGPDLLDFFTLIPLTFAIIFFINKLNLFNVINLSAYIFMLAVGFLIALSFHILVLCLAILTTEIDSAILLYRDLVSMGRMPIDIYIQPVRAILTFVIPVGIMTTFPVKSLFGALSPVLFIYSLTFALVLFYLSLKVWNFSLKKYSSASS